MNNIERLTKTLNCEIEALKKCIDSDLSEHWDSFVDVLRANRGSYYFSGVGKNQIVAKKIVNTMNSLNIKAHFIDPLNAQHGDIGVIDSNDMLIVFSKSGNTQDLLNICEQSKTKNVYTVAITCNADSALAGITDSCLVLPKVSEIDNDDLIPSASVIMFLSICDALTLCLSDTSFGNKTILKNHPGGELRKQYIKSRQNLEKRKRIKLLFIDVDGTLTNGQIYYSNNYSFVSYSVKDGYGISTVLTNHRIVPVIITSRNNKTLLARAEDIGVEHFYKNIIDKASFIKEFSRKHGVSLQETAYIGDDTGDLECMKICKLSACPSDSHEIIRKNCDFICTKKGGEGAVREFIDWICCSQEECNA